MKEREHLRAISGIGLHQCKPYENRLCYVPRFSADPVQGPNCAKKLYQGATVEELNHHCPMTCHQSTATAVSEIANETYAIAHPPENIIIKCNYQNYPWPRNISNLPGAVKIFLPCNCELLVNGEVLIPRKYPCRDDIAWEARTSHLLPAAWSNLKSFVLNPATQHFAPKYENIEECLNKNWTITIPHLNLTSSRNTVIDLVNQVRDELSQPPSYADSIGAHGDLTFLIWNVVLSLGLFHLLMRDGRLGFFAAIPQVQAIDPNEILVQHQILGYGCIIITCVFIFITIILFTRRRCHSLSPQQVEKPKANSRTNKYKVDASEEEKIKLKLRPGLEVDVEYVNEK